MYFLELCKFLKEIANLPKVSSNISNMYLH